MKKSARMLLFVCGILAAVCLAACGTNVAKESSLSWNQTESERTESESPDASPGDSLSESESPESPGEPEKSVELTLEDGTNEIGLTRKKRLSVKIRPYENPEVRYVFQKIEGPDGNPYAGELAEYAFVEEGYLATTDRIGIGAKISLYAETLADGVASDVLTVEVKRVEIESISVYTNCSAVYLGESVEFQYSIYPDDATVNVLKDSPVEVEVRESELAALRQNDDGTYTLTAFNKIANRNKKVTVTVTTEGFQKEHTWDILGIRVESITLYDAATNRPLEKKWEMRRGETREVYAVVEPQNATYEKIEYLLYADEDNFGVYVTASDEGVLTITESAPFGLEIIFNAYAEKRYSETHTITVIEVPVESLLLSAEKDTVHIGEIINLTLSVFPEDADVSSVVFKIINEAEGVLISGKRLWASERAAVGTEVEVAAFVNGIQSNVVKIRVIAAEEPKTTVLGTMKKSPRAGPSISQRKRVKKLKNLKKVKKTLDIIFSKCYYV